MNIEHGKSEQYQHQSDGNTPSKNEGVDNCTLVFVTVKFYRYWLKQFTSGIMSWWWKR